MLGTLSACCPMGRPTRDGASSLVLLFADSTGHSTEHVLGHQYMREGRPSLNLSSSHKLQDFCITFQHILEGQVLLQSEVRVPTREPGPVTVTMGSKGKESHKLGQGREAEGNRYRLLTRLICS